MMHHIRRSSFDGRHWLHRDIVSTAQAGRCGPTLSCLMSMSQTSSRLGAGRIGALSASTAGLRWIVIRSIQCWCSSQGWPHAKKQT